MQISKELCDLSDTPLSIFNYHNIKNFCNVNYGSAHSNIECRIAPFNWRNFLLFTKYKVNTKKNFISENNFQENLVYM